MKPKVKKMWVEALRSGNYKKICGLMRDGRDIDEDYEIIPNITHKNNSMCVMGVLADLALIDSGLKYNLTNWKKFAEYNDEPTDETLEWAGLSSDESSMLIGFNDKRSGSSFKSIKGKTFVELADYIEKNL